MALPETEDALKAMIEEARSQAATSKESELKKILEGTSFKSLEDLKNAHANAEKKISEQGTELGELRKKVSTPATSQTDDEVIASLSEEESEALAALYDKNKDIAKQIDSGGKKAQAEAIRSLREVKPKGATTNPFKKVDAAEKGRNLSKMIQDAIRGVERGSNRETGAVHENDSGKNLGTRSGVGGYFKK